MRILDKLKSLIEKLCVDKSFNIFSNNTTVNLHISGDSPKKVVVEGNRIVINPIKLSDPGALQDIVRIGIMDDNIPLLSQATADIIKDVREHGGEGKDIVDELSSIINPQDIIALRAAYLIKARHERGEDISNYKDDLVRNYGERGRKISNLCSSGYFEKQIILILHEMKEAGNFSKEKFLERYNLIVEEEAFSVFTHLHMSEKELYQSVIQKLERNRSYGVSYVNIHAIGQSNIKIVHATLRSIEEKQPGVQIVQEERVANTIFVRLESPEHKAA